ncbi:MAG: hypothetical protein MJY59_01015 [Bacteroidaceae bacterium]|nr:hypothetical protein [Bacteroidaceae bacterium]
MNKTKILILTLLCCMCASAWGESSIVDGAVYSLKNANTSGNTYRLFNGDGNNGSKFGNSSKNNEFSSCNFVFEHVDGEAENIFHIYFIEGKQYVQYASSAVDAAIALSETATSKWAVISDGDKISLATYETKDATTDSERLVWGCAGDNAGGWSAIRNNTAASSKWIPVKIGLAPSEVTGKEYIIKNTHGYLLLHQQKYIYHHASALSESYWVFEDEGHGFVSLHNTSDANQEKMGYENGAPNGQDRISTDYPNKNYRVMLTGDANLPYALRVDERQNTSMYVCEVSPGAKIGLYSSRTHDASKMNFILSRPYTDVLVYINSGRGNTSYFRNTGNHGIHINAKEEGNPYFMWYLLPDPDDNTKVNLYNLADGKRWGWTAKGGSSGSIKNTDDCLGYQFTPVKSGNKDYPSALQTVDNGNLYLSNYGGTSNDMGLYSDLNDGGTRFKFEEITSLYDIYTVNFSGLTGDNLANAYITTTDKSVNANVRIKNGMKTAWTQTPTKEDITPVSVGGYKYEVSVEGTDINVNYVESANTYSVVVTPSWLTEGGIHVGQTNIRDGESFEYTGEGAPVKDTDFNVNPINGYDYGCSISNKVITVTYTFAPAGNVLTFYHSARGNQRAITAVDNNESLGANIVMAEDLSDPNAAAANQKWLVEEASGSRYTLRALSNGRYMNLHKGGEQLWTTTVDLTDDDATTSYAYLLNVNNDETYNIAYATSGTTAAHEAANQRLVVWTLNADASRWKIIAQPKVEYSIYSIVVNSPEGQTGGITCKAGTTPVGNTTLRNTGEAFFFTSPLDLSDDTKLNAHFGATEIFGYEPTLSYDNETKTISVAYTLTKQLFTITYNIYFNGEKVLTETFNNVVEGSSYPTCTSPLPDGASVTYPEGTVTKTETKDLTMTFSKFVISTTENPTWYYIRMRDNQYAYYDASNTQSQQTPAASSLSYEDNFRWAFVGTPFGFNIINKAAKDGEGNYLYMYHNTSSDKNNVFQSEGTEFIYVEAAAQEGRDIYIKINNGGTHYINRNGGFYFWNNGGAKGEIGSAMAFELYDPAHDIAELQGKTKIGATSDPDVTVIYPGEFNHTPAQIDAAIDAIDAIDVNTATTDEMETALRTYGPALRNYVSATTSYGALATVNYTLAAEYGTIMLPSNVAKPQNLTIYSCAATDGNVLTLSTAQNFKSNTPYIVCGTTGSKYQFIGYNGATEGIKKAGLLYGTYSPITDVNAIEGKSEGRVYVLKSQGGKLGFYQLDPATTYSTLTIGANRCYLTLPAETSVKALYFDTDEVPTDIRSAVDSESSDFRTFNLAGQTVGAGFSGIVIRNGKKYLKVSSKNSPF